MIRGIALLVFYGTWNKPVVGLGTDMQSEVS